MSLVTRHLARHAAAALAGKALAVTGDRPAAPAPAAVDPEYAALLERLGNDLHTLHNIQSIELKIATKADLIGQYRDWVEGALRAGQEGKVVQDDIVAAMLIWSLDIQDWTFALQVGAHVLTHHVSLERFVKRTPGTVIAEEVADAALKDVDAVDHGTLIAVQSLTDDQDMPDEVRAKLMKAIGRRLTVDAEAFDATADNAPAGGKPALMQAAIDALKRALALDARAGVKRDIETLERELKKLSPPT